MLENKFERRTFLQFCALGLGAAMWSSSTRAANGTAQNPGPVRPPGACRGYTDGEGDGICNRSTKATKRCTDIKCPANNGNAGILTRKSKGAPASVCGLWQDKDKKGHCSISEPGAKSCALTKCPAHKDHSSAPSPAVP